MLGMVIGGMGGSTAGGIKLFRLVGLIALLGWLFKRALLPGSAQVPLKALGDSLSEDDTLALAGYVLLYFFVLAAATLVLVAMGYPLGASLFEVASAQGTAGLSVGIARPGAPAGVKLVLMCLMLMGRLEILPVIFFLRRAVRRR
ncbi:TPA: TrkH family potassium uptake protein [Candidatus Micrarchaeota archaeon]|nr:TrkH family potassium uptake protein [Candidatus Micrarchaeota archaeon]